MRSKFTSFRSKSAIAKTAFTHISAISRLQRPTLQKKKYSEKLCHSRTWHTLISYLYATFVQVFAMDVNKQPGI